MQFGKTHLVGIIIGAVLYELYYRKTQSGA